MSQENLHNDENLKHEAPFLFGLDKKEPFVAPDGYFEKFQLQLTDMIHAKKSSWWEIILKPVVWAPAMVILIVGGIFLFQNETAPAITNTHLPNTAAFSLNHVSFEELDSYVNDHLLAQANTEDIIEIVGDKNIVVANVLSSNESTEVIPAIQEVDEEVIEEYIMDNIDDMEI